MQWQATIILDGSSGSESVTAPQLHLASPIGMSPTVPKLNFQTETLPASPVVSQFEIMTELFEGWLAKSMMHAFPARPS
jgi:hypothetical protein